MAPIRYSVSEQHRQRDRLRWGLWQDDRKGKSDCGGKGLNLGKLLQKRVVEES
jgi:hypothetical protein